MVADGLYGKSPDLLDAVDAGVGVTPCGALAAATRGGLQRPQTPARPSREKGEARPQRLGVAPATAACTVAAVAARRPAAAWSRRPGAAGPPGPLLSALARQRVTLWKDGLPERSVGLVSKRRAGAAPSYSDYSRNAPASTPWRPLVW